MNSDRDDEHLRELMGELRKEDEVLAPDFSRVWRKAISESKDREYRRRRLRTRLAAAAILLILIAGSIRFLNHDLSDQRPQGPGTITEWRSPTTRLLRFSESGRISTGRFETIPAVRTHRHIRMTSRWSAMTAEYARPPGRSIPKKKPESFGTVVDSA